MARDGVRRDILARYIIILRYEVPTLFLHVPMYGCEGYNIFKPFELPHNQCSMG